MEISFSFLIIFTCEFFYSFICSFFFFSTNMKPHYGLAIELDTIGVAETNETQVILKVFLTWGSDNSCARMTVTQGK